MLDINLFQELISDLSNDPITNKKYVFYYDETNNYRKVTIRENNLNITNAFTDDFILGGFCHNEKTQPNITELFNNLKIKKESELKSKSIYNCDFFNCLKKKETNIILEWIKNNGYIHYTIFNCFYNTVIDIVDSMFDTEIGKQMPKDYYDICKSELFLLLYKRKDDFIKIANKVNYPNIAKENVEVFCNWLITIIEEENSNNRFYLELFRQLVKSNRKKDSLIFLNDNDEKTIVNGFASLRQQKCIVFSKSTHIFDNEYYDEISMNNLPITYDNTTPYFNYKFVDSKENRFIQLSDVIIKLIFKFLNYLDKTPIIKIKEDIINATTVQKTNLALLIELFDLADKECKYFLCVTIAQDINYERGRTIEYIKQTLKDNQ